MSKRTSKLIDLPYNMVSSIINSKSVFGYILLFSGFLCGVGGGIWMYIATKNEMDAKSEAWKKEHGFP